VVVANPDSFTRLPEYREDEPTDNSDVINMPVSDTRIETNTEASPSAFDPNIIILKVFEDTSRHIPTQNLPSISTLHIVPTLPSESQMQSDKSLRSLSNDVAVLSRFEEAQNGGRDAHLLAHYKSHISRRVIQVGSKDVVEDIFEIQARTFSPVRQHLFCMIAC
jgi:hypothetical protein